MDSYLEKEISLMEREFSQMRGVLVPYQTAAVAYLDRIVQQANVTKATMERIGMRAARWAYRRAHPAADMDETYFGALNFYLPLRRANVKIRVCWKAVGVPIEVYADKRLPERVVDTLCRRVARAWEAHIPPAPATNL